MPRSVKEWIGKTEDSSPLKSCRDRVFDRYNETCHICKLPIKTGETWHADHIIALIEGGENRESNLAPAHPHCNLKKASGEKTRKAKVARVRQKHRGIKNPKKAIKSPGFPTSNKRPKIDKAAVVKAANLKPKLFYQVKGE